MANTKQNQSTSKQHNQSQNAVGSQQRSSQKLSGFSQLSQQWDKPAK